MKKSAKKLHLGIETMKLLSKDELIGVNGGRPGTHLCGDTVVRCTKALSTCATGG